MRRPLTAGLRKRASFFLFFVFLEGTKPNADLRLRNRLLPFLFYDLSFQFLNLHLLISVWDRLCGLVVRVSGYRYRGLGFDSRRYQIF